MNHFLIDSLFEIMRVLMGTSEIKIKKMGGGGHHMGSTYLSPILFLMCERDIHF